MVWTKLTWNIVDDDKSELLQIFSPSTPLYRPRPRCRTKSFVSKYKFHNKLVRINFQWMAEYLFVSTHTIQLYWTDCILVYRRVPESPLQKRLYRRNMLQYHHQDWNQCPLFPDLKTCVNMFGTFVENMFQDAWGLTTILKSGFLPKKFSCIGWCFWPGFAMIRKAGSRRTKYGNNVIDDTKLMTILNAGDIFCHQHLSTTSM